MDNNDDAIRQSKSEHILFSKQVDDMTVEEIQEKINNLTRLKSYLKARLKERA